MTQLVIISIYLSLLLILGVFASRMFRGTSNDYMLASHSIGPFLLLMSIFGTTMTAFALVGSTGESYKEGVGVYGMLASSSGIIHSLCFFVIGVKLWTLGRRHGYTTQIQYFRDRFQSDKIGLLLFPILVGLVIPYLLIGVLASGTVINGMTEGAFQTAFAQYDYGVPNWLGSLVICGVVLIYVFFGGMRGTAWANAFQTCVFMVLGVVTFFMISGKLGGLEAASKAVLEKTPSKLMRTVTPEEQQTYETTLKKWQALSRYNWAVKNQQFKLDESQSAAASEAFKPRMPGWPKLAAAAYSAKNKLFELSPDDAQRAYILQDDRQLTVNDTLLDAQGQPYPLKHYSRLATPIWQSKAEKIFGKKIGHPSDPENWSRKKAFGVYKATHWAPEELHTLSKLVFFTYLFVPLSVAMFPHLFQHWLTAKSAGSFKLPVVAHPIFIMIVWVPCVLVGVWATAALAPGTERALVAPHFPPNAVLAYMVKQLTGPLLGGLLTAGILAAIMSSLDSQFLCIGTMFTNDIVVHYGGRDRFTDRQKILLARGFIVAIVAVTYAFSLFEPRRVFTLGVWCFSGFSSLFPLVFASLYWRRMTLVGALLGVLGSIVSWGYLFAQSGFGANPHYHPFGVMPVAIMVSCSTLGVIVGSLISRPPDEEHLARFFDQ
jgi:SSS family solute:Na+ symporter